MTPEMFEEKYDDLIDEVLGIFDREGLDYDRDSMLGICKAVYGHLRLKLLLKEC